MNMLTVCALVCTIVALAGSAVLPERKAESNERDTATTHLIERSSGCDDGWSEFNRRCFYHVSERMTWSVAEKNCISLGGHLASVHNILEYHELQRLILSGSHQYIETWIGGYDTQGINHWFWSDGTTVHFTNWCPAEPDNYGGHQHCLQMNYGVGNCWDDTECYALKPSVCAKNM
ncbi:type-2 ice-structuring protein-like [Archocentrus centrarchus]|uniref:type-2 ice-structuring protein-like n=1 Tax=Archocentrus centrarchus TaxID=63155 RepID=UPI0011E9E8B2|nr:type-2 ice-structuring protein-like [Archocentrus centrarchus]